MTGIFYFIIIVVSNTIGAISGIGGGIIIKPLFDFIGHDSVIAVSFYSTVAVATMSVVSTLRHIVIGHKFNWTVIFWISCGSILGGVIGNESFEHLIRILENQKIVLFIQTVITILSLIFAFLYSKYDWQHYSLNNVIWYFICGLFLGFLASFLGIGGGPINVSLLMLMFSLSIKEATFYSICTILFSQFSKLATIALFTGFARYDLSILYFIIPAAILGGLIGSKLNQILSDRNIIKIFQIVIVVVIFINIYNGLGVFYHI